MRTSVADLSSLCASTRRDVVGGKSGPQKVHEMGSYPLTDARFLDSSVLSVFWSSSWRVPLSHRVGAFLFFGSPKCRAMWESGLAFPTTFFLRDRCLPSRSICCQQRLLQYVVAECASFPFRTQLTRGTLPASRTHHCHLCTSRCEHAEYCMWINLHREDQMCLFVSVKEVPIRLSLVAYALVAYVRKSSPVLPRRRVDT